MSVVNFPNPAAEMQRQGVLDILADLTRAVHEGRLVVLAFATRRPEGADIHYAAGMWGPDVGREVTVEILTLIERARMAAD